MTQAAQPWTPLTALAGRFDANVAALAARAPALADDLRRASPTQCHVRATGHGLTLGIGPEPIRAMPITVSAAIAHQTAAALCPTGRCETPILVAGEDQGWLWDRLYRLPCGHPTMPGWRPPLYFVLPDLDRLAVLLHLHDWRALLADRRVQLFAGADAVDQLRHHLATESHCPMPQRWVTADPAVWPAGQTFESIRDAALAAQQAELASHLRRLATRPPASSPDRPLRVLGMTSRYTTFLRHSMRHWLAAFDRLGHTTQLLVERADHELATNLTEAATVDDFAPDLVVCIDHLRHESGVVPPAVPFVCWVQDAMPNLYSAEAGRRQVEADYAIGFGRGRLTGPFGYPADRFMSCPIPVNDADFTPDGPPDERFAADVSYVSHASATAEAVFTAAVEPVTNPVGRRAFDAAFERVRAVYEAGGCLTETAAVMRRVDAAFADAGAVIADDERPGVTDLFVQRVNNALFRHQALAWVADLGVDLRLYGNGWDRHPTLARFARGPINSPADLAAVHRSSRIGLQISPFGNVHQRVFEGLAAGGLFLMRACPGDTLERDYRTLWDWCRANGVTTDAQLRNSPAAAPLVAAVAEQWQADPFALHAPLTDLLRMSAEDGYLISAGTIWDGDYDAVAFGSAAQLRQRVAHYLGDDDARRARAASMRRAVMDRFTYVATTRRLLEFIAADRNGRKQYRTAA